MFSFLFFLLLFLGDRGGRGDSIEGTRVKRTGEEGKGEKKKEWWRWQPTTTKQPGGYIYIAICLWKEESIDLQQVCLIRLTKILLHFNSYWLVYLTRGCFERNGNSFCPHFPALLPAVGDLECRCFVKFLQNDNKLDFNEKVFATPVLREGTRCPAQWWLCSASSDQKVPKGG